MSETRWTPGPWRVGKPGEKTGTLNMVIGPDNKMTAFTGNPARDDAEIADNAHLTAAAPDMAEALALFERQWNACGPNSDFGRYFQNVRDAAVAALRKARGE